MEIRKERVFEEVVYTCDFCKEKARGWKCRFCKRDLCIAHAIADSDEDYPNYYCHPCWQAGIEIRSKLIKENERHDKAIENLEKEWKNNALSGIVADKNYSMFTENE